MQIINAFINSLRIFNNLFNHKGILHHKRLITHNYTKIKCKLLILSFGVPATSSYQVEGGITNNDWSYFTTSEPIKNRISSLTKPSIFYKDRSQVRLQPAEEAVRFWDPDSM